jgi:cysteine desulfurase/selenocysteine lyase
VSSFNARRVRADIPLLRRVVNGRTITYLDSAASSLQPRAVIEAMSRYYELRHANVHRGVYQTANEATAAYEGARGAVATFINAPGGADEVVFTKNTTESINLLAHSWGSTT